MSYTPTVWKSGDVVTSAKLNKLENGVEAAAAAELPTVGSSDNGKIPKVVDGEWAAVDDTFIITCTPTAPDMSGTTDKTAQEAFAAYQAGKNIKIRVYDSESDGYNEVVPYAIYVGDNNGQSFLTLSASLVDREANLLMVFSTSSTSATYGVNIYTLTPYSP